MWKPWSVRQFSLQTRGILQVHGIFVYTRYKDPSGLMNGESALLTMTDIIGGMNHHSDFFKTLGVDPDLPRLLDVEGITLQDLECFQHWRRVYNEEDIADFFKIPASEDG
jgi:hypothetical protein